MFKYLHKKLNTFYDKIFQLYGIFLSKYFIYIICVTIFINILLSLGIFKINYLSNYDDLFVLKNSINKRNEIYLKNLFNSNHGINLKDSFSLHQSLDFGAYGEINFHLNGDENIFNPVYLEEIRKVNDIIKKDVSFVNYQYDGSNRTLSYTDLCAKTNKKCSVEGEGVLFSNRLLNCEMKTVETCDEGNETISQEDKLIIDIEIQSALSLEFTLGPKFRYVCKNDKLCPNSNMIKLRYTLDYLDYEIDSTQNSIENSSLILARRWENEFIKFMKNFKLNNSNMTFTYSISQSFEQEMKTILFEDLFLVVITVSCMIFLTILFLQIKSNYINAPGIVVPMCGFFCAFSGFTSGVGFLSLFSYPACDIVYTIAFLLLGKLRI